MLRELLIETGLLRAVLEPIILLVVPPLVSWFAYRWHRLTGRDNLHAALENAVKVGLNRANDAGLFGARARERALTEAVSYVSAFNGGALKKFKLGPDHVRQLAEAHLPLQR